MEHEQKWYKEREEWRKVTKPYPSNTSDIFKPNELSM
jgi:hypothetical protein